MSSLKMTFSLASLVLILGLVFATAPVMAQDDSVVIPTAAEEIPMHGFGVIAETGLFVDNNGIALAEGAVDIDAPSAPNGWYSES